MRRRDKALSHYKQSKLLSDFEAFKSLRNKVKRAIRNAKAKFAEKLLQDSSSKSLWRGLSKLGIGISKDSIPHNLRPDNLNDHFVNNHTKITPQELHESLLSISRLTPLTKSEFNFKPVSINEVKSSLLGIKSTAIGIDGIPIQFIHKILNVFLPYITHIFNSSLSQGIFPSQWKTSVLHPIPKVSTPHHANDFRPISILPSLSKGLERLVHLQFSKFLSENNLFDPFQSGFRRHHSTSTALTKVTDDIKLAMDNKKITFLVLIDLSKAFNSVEIDLLLAKLKRFNLSQSALSWFSSYLVKRSQTCFTNECYSSILVNNHGVPQGSILGPLLFSLYLQDLSSHLNHSSCHLYADDLQIYLSTKEPKNSLEAIELLNNDISLLHSWL